MNKKSAVFSIWNWQLKATKTIFWSFFWPQIWLMGTLTWHYNRLSIILKDIHTTKRTNFFYFSSYLRRKENSTYVIEKTTFYTSWLVKKTRKCNSKRRGGSDVSRFGILCFLPFLGLISGKSYSAKMSYVINVVVLLVVTVVGCAHPREIYIFFVKVQMHLWNISWVKIC